MQKKVIIAGAGTAGCIAAMHLIKNGIHVELFEAKSNIGGRAFTITDNTTGEEIDNGQHIMIGAYHEFLQFVNMLNNNKYLEFQDALNIVFRDKKDGKFEFDTSKLVGDLGKVSAIMQFPRATFRAKIRAINFSRKVIANKVNGAGMTALELLKKYKQDDYFIKAFWEPLVVATLNSKIEEASAELLINVLRLGFLGKPEHSRIIMPSSGLSYLFRGFDKWIEEHGSRLHLGKKIRSLIIEDGKCTGVETSDGEKLEADAVILAATPESIKNILGENLEKYDEFKALNEYKYSTIISTYLWLDKEIMPEKFAALLESTAQWVFNRRRISRFKEEQLEKYPGHLTVTISAANELEDLPNEELLKRIWDDIQNTFKHGKEAKILHHKIIKDKRATFLANPETEKIRPDNKTGIENLYLAGDWTNTKLPATIEGAAVSGKKAAEYVMGV